MGQSVKTCLKLVKIGTANFSFFIYNFFVPGKSNKIIIFYYIFWQLFFSKSHTVCMMDLFQSRSHYLVWLVAFVLLCEVFFVLFCSFVHSSSLALVARKGHEPLFIRPFLASTRKWALVIHAHYYEFVVVIFIVKSYHQLEEVTLAEIVFKTYWRFNNFDFYVIQNGIHIYQEYLVSWHSFCCWMC